MSRDAFRQTDAADLLKNYRKSAPLTADQRRCVLDEVHRLFADTEASLRNDYPALSDEDVELCLLSALQYPVSAVADCLSVSEEAVRVRKHRLKSKLPQEVLGVFWEGRAGTRLLKTLFMKDTMQNVWRRFPLTVIWLVLLTAYAVRGLDIGASYTIYDMINLQKEKGVAVIYVGEDLDVLLELSDRILVLCGGKVSGIVDGRSTNKREVGMMMTRLGGGKSE